MGIGTGVVGDGDGRNPMPRLDWFRWFPPEILLLFIDCSIVALTAGLEKLASRMTRLTLGSSSMDMISCSSSTLTAKSGCCCCSGQPRRWWACARFNAAMSAFETGGSVTAGDDVPDGSRSNATLKQSSSARHWRGCEELGWDRMQACRRKPVGAARSVAATWRGVVWLWFRRPASAIEWFKTLAASGVRVWRIVLNPVLIITDYRIKIKVWSNWVSSEITD